MSFLDSQKTQSIVGIANLAQNKKINKSLEELRRTQEEAAKNAELQARLQKEANKLEQQRLSAERQRLSAQEDAARSAEDAAKYAKMQLEIQRKAEQRRILKEEQEESLRQELKIKKQTIFNLRQDTKAILKSDKNKIEKFFDLNAISLSLKDSNIIATDFDDYTDKEYLAQTKSELDDAILVTHESMNEEEISDLEKINEVLLVDEESKLKNVKRKIDKKKQLIDDIDNSLQSIEGIKVLSELESIIEKYGKS